MILSLDTALGPCAVGLSVDGSTSQFIEDQERAQAKILVPMIDQIIQDAGIAYQDLTHVVTSVGPGSFTGLRISLATARALGLSLDIPVSGLSTLDVIAHQTDTAGLPVCVVLESKRQDFYARWYDENKQPFSPAMSNIPESIMRQAPEGNYILAGNAADRFLENAHFNTPVRTEEHLSCDPKMLCALADVEALHLPPQPVYMREADVSAPKKKPRKMV